MKKREMMMLMAVITLLSIATLPTFAQPAEPHNANAMWIEPSTIDLRDKPVGYRFNVTVWVNVSIGLNYVGGWQFVIVYEKEFLNVTRVGYTAGDKSEFFHNITTMPVDPDLGSWNATHNYVQHGESWLMGDMRRPGYGSLSWIEFEVIKTPEAEYVGKMSLVTTGIRHSYVIDEDGIEVDLNPYAAEYIIPEFTSMYILILTASTLIAIFIIKRKTR